MSQHLHFDRTQRALLYLALVSFTGGCGGGPGGEEPVEAKEGEPDAPQATELKGRLEALEAREQELLLQLSAARAELVKAEEARLAREREWLAWTQAVSKLGPEARVVVPDFEVELDEEELETLSPDAAPLEEPRDEARLARSEEIERWTDLLGQLCEPRGLLLQEEPLRRGREHPQGPHEPRLSEVLAPREV